MKLRPYQEKAVSKMMWAMTLKGNDVVVLAQGGGKTHIIAEFTKRLGKPILILVPNKELLEQDLEKLSAVVPKSDIGVYSASMNSKEVRKYTLATIQSAYRHPEKFAHYNVVVVDECDLIPLKKMSSMYMKLFKALGNPKVFGLTGTPYRQDVKYERWGSAKWQVTSITTTKMINRYKGFFWSRFLTVINTKDLLEKGYLSPLVYHEEALMDHQSIPTNKSKSDFDMDKFNSMISDKHMELASKISKLPHKAKLVFCANIDQAEALASLIDGAKVVTSKTKKKERAQAVSDLKNGNLEVLLNVGIYTVGFDYPELDCIVLLRPTRSLRLHSQILGRVSRIAEGKKAGHVYDYVSNVKNLGRLEDIVVERAGHKNLWNVTSPARPDGFHMEALYKYKLQKPKS